MNDTNHDTNMTGNADNRSDLRTNCGHEINQDVQDPYEREAAKAAIKVLKRELAEAREQRDGAFSLIDYAGELLGVPKQEHKSAHGFKILQAIKELAETRKDYKCLAELLDGHDATECRANLLRMKQELARWRELPAKVEGLIPQTNIPLSAAQVRTTALYQVLDFIAAVEGGEA